MLDELDSCEIKSKNPFLKTSNDSIYEKKFQAQDRIIYNQSDIIEFCNDTIRNQRTEIKKVKKQRNVLGGGLGILLLLLLSYLVPKI